MNDNTCNVNERDVPGIRIEFLDFDQLSFIIKGHTIDLVLGGILQEGALLAWISIHNPGWSYT